MIRLVGELSLLAIGVLGLYGIGKAIKKHRPAIREVGRASHYAGASLSEGIRSGQETKVDEKLWASHMEETFADAARSTAVKLDVVPGKLVDKLKKLRGSKSR